MQSSARACNSACRLRRFKGKKSVAKVERKITYESLHLRSMHKRLIFNPTAITHSKILCQKLALAAIAFISYFVFMRNPVNIVYCTNFCVAFSV